MSVTTEEIISELETAVEAAYGDANALTIVEGEMEGEVLVFPHPGQRGPDAWEIAIRPGPLPLFIHVIGNLPTADPRFQRAISEKLSAWLPDPERLNAQDAARLEELRARIRGEYQ